MQCSVMFCFRVHCDTHLQWSHYFIHPLQHSWKTEVHNLGLSIFFQTFSFLSSNPLFLPITPPITRLQISNPALRTPTAPLFHSHRATGGLAVCRSLCGRAPARVGRTLPRLGGKCGTADAMDGSSLAASPWVPVPWQRQRGQQHRRQLVRVLVLCHCLCLWSLTRRAC